MKSFIVLFTLVGGCSAASQTVCDSATFTKCQTTFNQFLNLPAGADWTNPPLLLSALSNIYITGGPKNSSGLVQVCNGYNQMINCFQAAGVTGGACFDPLFLIDNDNVPTSAYMYAMIIKMLQFHCGAGFYPALDNWPCVQTVYQNNNASLQNCMITFLISAGADPQNTCAYYTTGIQCYERLWRTCREEVQYYGCESFRQFANVLFDYCGQTCTVRRRPAVGEEIEWSNEERPMKNSRRLYTNLAQQQPIRFQQHHFEKRGPLKGYEPIF